ASALVPLGVNQNQFWPFRCSLVVQEEALAVAGMFQQAFEEVDMFPLPQPQATAVAVAVQAFLLAGSGQEELFFANDAGGVIGPRRSLWHAVHFAGLKLAKRSAVIQDQGHVGACPFARELRPAATPVHNHFAERRDAFLDKGADNPGMAIPSRGQLENAS